MSFVKEQLLELAQQGCVYHPSNYNFLIFINSILHKHQQPLLLPSANDFKKYKPVHTSDLFIHWYCDNETGLRKLDVPDLYIVTIKRSMLNKKTRFIAFPLVMHHSHQCAQVQTRSYSHMTLVLYDKKYQYLEFFDSATHVSKFNIEIAPTVLMNVLYAKFKLPIKRVIPPSRICPMGGIQHLQEQEVYKHKLTQVLGGNIGFCSIYSIMYLDARLSTPNTKPDEVIRRLLDTALNNNKSLTKNIVDYLKELIDVQQAIEEQMNPQIVYKIKQVESNKLKLSDSEKVEILKQVLTFLMNHFKS